jgi:DNA polymerase-1
MMPWARMLLETELRGVTLDMRLLAKKEDEAQGESERLKQLLDEAWEEAYIQYFEEQRQVLAADYLQKQTSAIDKRKDKTAKSIEKTTARYQILFNKAVSKIPQSMNIDSPAQLLWILRDYYGLDVNNFEDEESTGKAVLQKLAANRKDIQLLLQYREQRKLCTSFFPTYRDLQDNGVLRCNFNLTGTVTGRLSSSTPNLQQVPGHLHSLFVARPGYKIITRDASYIEPRLAAYYTEDPFLCDIAISGKDFHSENAKLMFGLDCDAGEVKTLFPQERKLAKTVGLALLYGAGPSRIYHTALQQGFNWSYNHCKQVYDNFKESYREAFEVKEAFDTSLIDDSFANFFGRKRLFQDPSEIYMQGFNSLIQGTASDLILDSAYCTTKVFQECGIAGHLLLLVHDEQVWEVSEGRVEEAERIIERNMVSYSLSTKYGEIPLKVEGKTDVCWSK